MSLDVKGFAFRHCGQSSKEDLAILNYCILNRIPYKFCRKPEERPEGYIPAGSVEWCENFLTPEQTRPNYYPDCLKDYLFRNIWTTDTWPMEKGIFVKPADRHKRFTGLLTVGGYKKKKKGPYICSEKVAFINEWRYYVAEGKVLTGEWYMGDEVNTPDAPELNIQFPEGYCAAVDFGMLTTGEMALVEAHLPYACGWYGKNYELYVEWIVKGWEYIIAKGEENETD